MIRSDPSRVVAIMAKAARAGHVKTRLSAVYPADVVLELYRALVEDSIGVATGIGASVAVVCPAGDSEEIRTWLPPDVLIVPQHGRGLADGLHSCFDLLCDRSGRRVIAFNSDSPHLPPQVLDSAFAALADRDVVIGPCVDGGYYLVGLTRPHAGLFDPQAMGSGTAFQTLIARAERLGLSAAVTSEQYDIDLPQDLIRLARELVRQPQCAPKTAAVLAAWPTGTTAPTVNVVRRGQV